tara:strand:- start:5091 stop:5675 length:585 start_codon:yes stop_codon:yes gene_type:complete
MKIFFIVSILIFSFYSLTKADDIRDFEIEGMSIGDSALDYFSEHEIKKNIRKNAYKGSNGKFYDAGFKSDKYKTYDKVTIAFKKNDEKYIIYSLAGLIFYGDDTVTCNADYKKIVKNIESLFHEHKKNVRKNIKHPADKSGKSLFNGTSFIHKSSSGADVACYSWSNEMNNEDYVSVAIDSSEFGKWLDAYYDN